MSISFERGLSPLGDPSLSEWPDMMEDDPVLHLEHLDAMDTDGTIMALEGHEMPADDQAALQYFTSMPPSTMSSERDVEMDSPNKRVRVKSPWIRQQQQQLQQQQHQQHLQLHQAPMPRQRNYYLDEEQSVEMMR